MLLKQWQEHSLQQPQIICKMINGTFVNNTPLIKVVVAWGQSVQASFVVLDTGFTGDLQVTPKIATELGLKVVGVTKTQIANGQIIQVPVALAIASMEGVAILIQVLISDSFPLAGISFLTKFGYKALVDCKYRIISLEINNRESGVNGEGGLDMNEGSGIRTAVDLFIIRTNPIGQTEVLLGLRRAKAGERTWGFVGGHQKTGETLLETARREAKEELGNEINLDITEKVVAVRQNKIPPWYVPHLTVILETNYLSGEPQLPAGERTDAWKWYPLDGLPEETFSGVKDIVDCYLRREVRIVTDWQ